MNKFYRYIGIMLVIITVVSAMGITVYAENVSPTVTIPVEPDPTVTETPVEPDPTVTETPVEPDPTVTETPVEPDPTVTETPVEPDPTVTETPAPNSTETPAPNSTETPAPNSTETPAPNATETPAPNATETPAPNATETPVPTVTQSPSGGSGGGSSSEDYGVKDKNVAEGGSRSMSTSNIDPFSNIEKHETIQDDLIINKPKEYSFSTKEFCIYKVFVNGKENERDTSVMIEHLKSRSKYIKKRAPGVIYQNENVWIGTGRVNNISVSFKVNNSWIDENVNDSNFISLLRWNGTAWIAYKANITGKDDLYTYFSSPNISAPILKKSAASLSLFAIGALPIKVNKVNKTDTKLQVDNVSNATRIQGDNKQIVPDANSTKRPFATESPGFDAIITIVGIIFSVIYVTKKK